LAEGGWSLLFLRRSANLAAHSGQIAFPGGGVEEGEPLETAAVREAHEEVGIATERVELIGRLDDLITNSGFLVAPFVGVVDQRIDYVLQAAEVDEVFEVPIEALLTPEQPEVRYVAFRSKSYPAYFYQYERHEIWGLTGRMLKHFLDFVWSPGGDPRVFQVDGSEIALRRDTARRLKVRVDTQYKSLRTPRTP
jgi:8-oxo-dGTP pyrophosphatase MutT (NUDIX family)